MPVRDSLIKERNPCLPNALAAFTPHEIFLVLLSRPQGHSAARTIFSIKNSNDTIGNRTVWNYSLYTSKDKLHSVVCTENEQSYNSTFSLTLALDVAGCSTPRSGHFTPGKRLVAYCKCAWVGPRADIEGCEKSRPYRDSIPRPPIPQRIAVLDTVVRKALRQVAGPNKFRRVTFNICGFSVQNLLHVIVLTPRIWKWPLDFFSIFENLNIPVHVYACRCQYFVDSLHALCSHFVFDTSSQAPI